MAGDGRAARGDARKLLLLDAAVRVVAAHGSGALTHRAAAAEAEVSNASVTYHFPSIGDLRRATFEHAGSRIGLDFVAMIAEASSDIERIPVISGDFVGMLATERRVETIATLEMILAASHDPELRPVIRFFDDRLSELFLPYVGDRGAALTIASSIQGLLLTVLASDDPDAPVGLRGAVIDLIHRYRAPVALIAARP
jgi:TetR/AcrR family transcriptional regulator, regulator of biofilm formation and stress response